MALLSAADTQPLLRVPGRIQSPAVCPAFPQSYLVLCFLLFKIKSLLQNHKNICVYLCKNTRATAETAQGRLHKERVGWSFPATSITLPSRRPGPFCSLSLSITSVSRPLAHPGGLCGGSGEEQGGWAGGQSESKKWEGLIHTPPSFLLTLQFKIILNFEKSCRISTMNSHISSIHGFLTVLLTILTISFFSPALLSCNWHIRW